MVEGDAPFGLRKAFPPFHLMTWKTQALGEVAHSARHYADLGMRQTTQRGLVKMVVVRMREQHQVNRRQIADAQARALDALQCQKQPVLQKLGSINTFKSVNWMRNEAWPIQVIPLQFVFNLGKIGTERAAMARGAE